MCTRKERSAQIFGYNQRVLKSQLVDVRVKTQASPKHTKYYNKATEDENSLMTPECSYKGLHLEQTTKALLSLSRDRKNTKWFPLLHSESEIIKTLLWCQLSSDINPTVLVLKVTTSCVDFRH